MKLTHLFEDEKKNLIGLEIDCAGPRKIITDQTPKEHWNGSFECAGLGLTSLKGAPASVQTYFECMRNKLTSLEGAPAKIGTFFSCSDNKFTSLEGIHKIIKEVGGVFYATRNTIKSHVLGLLLIKSLTMIKIDNKEVENILNKHLPNKIGNKGVLACQNDLLDAGFDDFAQL